MRDKQNRAPKKHRSDFHHSKRLGQNFLVDAETIAAIIDGSDIDEETAVIEIGPGEGALTSEFVERAGRVIAIELDDRLIPKLHKRFQFYDNIDIIHADILKTDVAALIENAHTEYGMKKVRIIGNLPYYITTPIIMNLVQLRLKADGVTAMMQKEVADRLLAEPGTSKASAITYVVHYYSEVSKIRDVDKTCFYPMPKVDSTLIRMDLRDEPSVKVRDEKLFFRCIKAGFMLRRKTLANSLSTMDDFDRDTINRVLNSVGVDSKRRAESLSMQEFADISDALLEA